MGKFYRPNSRQVLDCGSPLPLFCPAISRLPKRQRTGALQDATATSLLKFVCAMFILVSKLPPHSRWENFYCPKILFLTVSLTKSLITVFITSIDPLPAFFISFLKRNPATSALGASFINSSNDFLSSSRSSEFSVSNSSANSLAACNPRLVHGYGLPHS